MWKYYRELIRVVLLRINSNVYPVKTLILYTYYLIPIYYHYITAKAHWFLQTWLKKRNAKYLLSSNYWKKLRLSKIRFSKIKKFASISILGAPTHAGIADF